MSLHCKAAIVSWQNLLVAGTFVTAGGKHPNSKVHRAYMGPTWGRQDPGGPHVGPMSLVIWQNVLMAVIVVTAGGNHGNLQMMADILAFQLKSDIYSSFVLV